MNRATIIIPCYAQAQYLPEAIESALAQTEPCDVIVVNDGSPDNTKEAAAKYLPKIRLVNQVNKGLASARNTGIMNAATEWILPLDADDVLDPKCAGELLLKADETGADVVAPSLRTFGLANETIILKEDPTLADFRVANRIGYFSLIKREVLLECGGYSPRMEKGWEDYALWFDLLTRGKRITTVPQPLVSYRLRANSMWQESKKHEKELWDQIFKDFPQILPEQ